NKTLHIDSLVYSFALPLWGDRVRWCAVGEDGRGAGASLAHTAPPLPGACTPARSSARPSSGPLTRHNRLCPLKRSGALPGSAVLCGSSVRSWPGAGVVSLGARHVRFPPPLPYTFGVLL